MSVQLLTFLKVSDQSFQRCLSMVKTKVQQVGQANSSPFCVVDFEEGVDQACDLSTSGVF